MKLDFGGRQTPEVYPQSPRCYGFGALRAILNCGLRIADCGLLPFLLIVAVVFLSGCRSANKQTIVLAGSTSVEPFAERLAEVYAARQRQQKLTPVEINVQGGGSSAGIRAVQNGICQIGMSSRALTLEEEGLYEIPIALDGIVIVVHRDNPITNLTVEQAREIFTGRVRSWRRLGGPPRRITVITREEGSGTRASFEEKIMRPDPTSETESFARDALVQDSNGAVREIVAGDPDAVGYISFGLVDERVHALALDGIAPAEPAIRDGSYPIVRNFLFLTRAAPTGAVRDFTDYALSGAGQSVLVEEGLVRVSD